MCHNLRNKLKRKYNCKHSVGIVHNRHVNKALRSRQFIIRCRQNQKNTRNHNRSKYQKIEPLLLAQPYPRSSEVIFGPEAPEHPVYVLYFRARDEEIPWDCDLLYVCVCVWMYVCMGVCVPQMK
jgi:hypothetical protein